jgi:HAD superfamily phosphatase (TIGR01668 family)
VGPVWRDLRPCAWVRSVHDVDPLSLRGRGIRGLVLDLDNTLVRWNAPSPDAALLAWLDRVRGAGLSPCVVSNGRLPRVDAFCRRTELPGIAQARKPGRAAFRRALDVLRTQPAETAVIGDQVFTDVFGGNRAGLFTILVRPIDEREFAGTRAVRVVERAWLAFLRRRGELPILS